MKSEGKICIARIKDINDKMLVSNDRSIQIKLYTEGAEIKNFEAMQIKAGDFIFLVKPDPKDLPDKKGKDISIGDFELPDISL